MVPQALLMLSCTRAVIGVKEGDCHAFHQHRLPELHSLESLPRNLRQRSRACAPTRHHCRPGDEAESAQHYCLEEAGTASSTVALLVRAGGALAHLQTVMGQVGSDLGAVDVSCRTER